ncbi:hypothetical protein KKB18_07645 [bacterium]|nr:hypothetical protein [bacterium]
MYKLPEKLNLELKDAFKRTMIISIAMIIECPILFLIGYYLVEFSVVSTNPDFQGNEILKSIFLIIGILCLASALYLKKLILKPKIHEKAKSIFEIINKLSTFTIVIFAISDVPIVLGFVYYLLSGNMNVFQIMIIISIISYILCLPRLTLWNELLLYFVRNKPSMVEESSIEIK